jgi:hypothetical protein
VVEIFHSSRRAGDRKTKVLLDIVGSCAIGVCRLHDTNLDLVRETGCSYEIAKEGCDKRSNAVTIEESEHVLVVLEVVHNAIGITIE